jgi:transposase InsO family protein
VVLQESIIYRYGRLQRLHRTITLRSDNGLVFTSKSFTKTVKDYNFEQEFITPYTPQQNGMIERFFRTSQRRVYLAPQFHFTQGGQQDHQRVDQILQ